MESMFLWIVLFSGAAVLLLSLFLISSERELKKKRGEISDLTTRLGSAPTAATGAPHSGAEVTGLRAKIQELQKERASLQDDLDAAHRAIDELRDGKPALANGATLAEIEQLRNANTQLDGQLVDLRRQLQASQAQHQNGGNTDGANSERQTQLESALIDLKQQLERSQAKIRELESAPKAVADMTAMESSHHEATQKLQARIAELEKERAAGADHGRQLDGLQQRIRESEKIEQELRDSLRRREEEMSQWQARIAASEEIKNRLLALQPVYDQLVAKQSSLIESQRTYHGELKSFAQFLSASHDGTIPPPTYIDLQVDQESAKPLRPVLPIKRSAKGNDDNPSDTSVNNVHLISRSDPEPQPKRGLGVFHALIAVVVSGAMAALFWSQSGEQPVTHAAKPLPVGAPEKKAAPAPVPPKAAPAIETVAMPAPVNKPNDAPAAQPLKSAKVQPAPATAGTYEVTRGTRVFAAPTEFAQQVGEIEPGLKVNVVNARDGWLEIHSKHGRPPGYIRGDAVARVGR